MSEMSHDLLVIGAGLAGSEAAFLAARAGIRVRLVDIKPVSYSPAHSMPGPAELVCSNSLGSRGLETASGLLKEEMRRLGSVVLRAAEAASVPAGGSLAVDRRALSLETERLLAEAGVRMECLEIEHIPEEPCVIATGPLTADRLASAIAEICEGDSLFFYDATSPIVSADSVDREKIYAKSRWDKGAPDYLNCPMSKEEYDAFIAALLSAEKVTPRDFEDARLFDACMPIEDMAARGAETPAHGPMRPVGLDDPRTGRRPYAVVQLRREDAGGEAYSLVGFQTRLKHGDQERVFRMIPGLEHAEFLRLGVVHRNTYVDGPRVLDATLAMKARPTVRLAGQITGVEGYLESAGCGMLAGLFAAAAIRGTVIEPPPPASMLGALLRHATSSESVPFRPMNANLGILPPIEIPRRAGKKEKRFAKIERALRDFDGWLAEFSPRIF